MGLRGQEGGSWAHGEGAQPLGSEAVGVWPGLGGRRPGSAETTAPVEQHCSTLPSEHRCALEMPASCRSEGRRATHAHGGAGAGSEWQKAGCTSQRSSLLPSLPHFLSVSSPEVCLSEERFGISRKGSSLP